MNDIDDQIKSLIEKLNWWQRASGIDPDAITNVRSTGESNARIEDLKHKLDQLGADYYWDPGKAEYRLYSGGELVDEEE